MPLRDSNLPGANDALEDHRQKRASVTVRWIEALCASLPSVALPAKAPLA